MTICKDFEKLWLSLEQFKSIVAVPGVVLPPIFHDHLIFPGASVSGVLSPEALDSLPLGSVTLIKHWASGRVVILSPAVSPRFIGEVREKTFISSC